MGALTIAAKYLIVASFEVQGSVDKPDIIGAIFSQTEGLLGADLDLRELQMMGRVGRIEVEIERRGDKTSGKIYVPSNLNRYETALIAAALETVDRVGPYAAKVKIVEIKDLREEKRKRILERAKELAMKIQHEVLPDSKELINKLIEAVSEAELIRYGPEGLPAGPDVDRADTIIIVEGRADVLNLLRHGYRNVIAVEGASGGIPKTIIELSRKKTTIAFVDGDRGGEMLLRELIKVADIDYIARAPPGKEVEELTAKEIAKCLRNKIPVEEYLAQIREEIKPKPVERPQPQPVETTERREQRAEARQQVQVEVEQKPVQAQPVPIQVPSPPSEAKAEAFEEVAEKVEVPTHVLEEVKKLTGTLEAVLYDESWNEIKRVPVKDLIDVLQQLDNVKAIVMDGVCTQRLVDTAAGKGVKLIIASRIGGIAKMPENMKIVTIDEVLKQQEATVS
ncbi:MAG: DNA primase [Crenarchaeota archaeon]|nr:DNA primase [Thermoproteota archaeon]